MAPIEKRRGGLFPRTVVLSPWTLLAQLSNYCKTPWGALVGMRPQCLELVLEVRALNAEQPTIWAAEWHMGPTKSYSTFLQEAPVQRNFWGHNVKETINVMKLNKNFSTCGNVLICSQDKSEIYFSVCLWDSEGPCNLALHYASYFLLLVSLLCNSYDLERATMETPHIITGT